MTVQELHIELDLLLQKLNSHYNQNLLPQEKDVFLNREITRFIKQRLNRFSNIKGTALYDTVKRTIDLIPLVKTVKLSVIFDNQKEAKIMLPFDYLYYISAGLTSCCVCTNKQLVTDTYYELTFDPLSTLSDFPFTVRNGLFSFIIQAADIPDDYLIEHEIPIYKNNLMLIQALLILIQQKNNTLVEFRFDKVLHKFVARSPTSFSVNGKIATLHTFKRYEDFDSSLLAEVRLEDEEFKTKARKSYLSGSTDESCLAYLRENSVNFMIPTGVIYRWCELTYICKPSQINLFLQSNSNLTDAVMEEVVANTAQRLHSVIGTDNYEKFAKENILLE